MHDKQELKNISYAGAAFLQSGHTDTFPTSLPVLHDAYGRWHATTTLSCQLVSVFSVPFRFHFNGDTSRLMVTHIRAHVQTIGEPFHD